MNSKARDLEEWIASNGYGEYIGKAGSGHLKYRLRNGAVKHYSATPSKSTAVDNAKADVRRELGIQSESPNSGSYSHKTTDGYDGRTPRPGSAWDYPPEVKRLQVRLETIDAKILELHPVRDRAPLIDLARKRVKLAEALSGFGVQPADIQAVAS